MRSPQVGRSTRAHRAPRAVAILAALFGLAGVARAQWGAPTPTPKIILPQAEVVVTPAPGAASPPPSVAGPAPVAAPPAIGVVLPLSGRFQSFGESCLRGVRVALGLLDGQTPSTRVVILDSKGESKEAGAAYLKLANDPSIVAVIGPMMSADVDEILPYAQGFELPTFSFSPTEVMEGGPMFRFSLTKEDQASLLARHAVGERGLRRWAVLHPDDAYGREISAQFRRAVQRLGGHVEADVSYAAGKTDLQNEVKQLQAKIVPAAGQPAIVDGIFVPETADRLAAITSFLAFVDIRNVPLFGGSGWDRPQALLSANVDGGTFVDGFFLYSFRPEVRTFVDRYRDAFHGDPGTLEAYGYDAATLVRSLIQAGTTSRTALLAELRRPHVYRGATGQTVFAAGGKLEKGLFLLKVEEGTVRELDTSATSLQATGSEISDPSRASQGGGHPEFDSRNVDDRIGH